jgi:hypothetical protein
MTSLRAEIDHRNHRQPAAEAQRFAEPWAALGRGRVGPYPGLPRRPRLAHRAADDLPLIAGHFGLTASAAA